MSTELTNTIGADQGAGQVEFKSRMEQMQDRMDDVLDKVIGGQMDVATAKVVNSLFQTFINSANAEISFMQRTGLPMLKTAMTQCHTQAALPGKKNEPAQPAPVTGSGHHLTEATRHGVKHTLTAPNGMTSMVHQLGG